MFTTAGEPSLMSDGAFQDALLSFQLQSTSRVEFKSTLTWQGPCFVYSPCIDELQGPYSTILYELHSRDRCGLQRTRKTFNLFVSIYTLGVVVSLTLLIG
jgi:hypothetical protein